MPSNNTPTEEEKESDIVSSVLNGPPFKIRPDDEKSEILKKGRPLANLNIVKRDSGRNCDRSFQFSWYSVHKWLCGSTSYNKLFCWPCLLMRPETSSWCSIGIDDMKRFTSLATKHATCKSHLKAISEYDETLTKFGFYPEFANEMKFQFKEDGSSSVESEGDDLLHLYLNETKKKETAEIKSNPKGQLSASAECSLNATDCSKMSALPRGNSNITFKTWKEISSNYFPVSKSKFLEDIKLYKWKRKIAHQELKNARLTGEKIKFEIEVLKAKVEYYKSLKEETQKSKNSDCVTDS